jgi:hypothetical protein
MTVNTLETFVIELNSSIAKFNKIHKKRDNSPIPSPVNTNVVHKINKNLRKYQKNQEKELIEEDTANPIAKFYWNRRDIWNEPDRTNPYFYSD